jgi:hypothetical protein
MLMDILGIIGIILLFTLDRIVGIIMPFRKDRERYEARERYRRKKDWPYFY